MRDDCAILHIDIDVTFFNLFTVYHLAKEDMCDASGLVGVRVVVQDKTVTLRELIMEDRCNKGPSDIIRV